MDKELNERIAKYRDQKGYTQQQLGAMLGMKTSTYSQMERKGRVDSITLKKLAEIFKVDVRVLLYGETTDEQIIGINKQSDLQELKTITTYKTDFFDISVMEMLIIEYFRSLCKKEKQKIIDYINKKINNN